MSDQISNKLAGWAARARAAQVTLDLFSADRDKVARVAGQLLDLAQDVELAISAAPESDGDVARLDHVCVDGRNERCGPDHCAVAGCPVADRVETMRARLENLLGPDGEPSIGYFEITIVPARFGNGSWIAWVGDEQWLGEYWDCRIESEFWRKYDGAPVGRGADPNAALADLVRQAER